MNLEHIVSDKTFQKLGVESEKLDFNFDLSRILEKWDFGAKVLSQIRSQKSWIYENNFITRTAILLAVM